jgi:hypothetical protein
MALETDYLIELLLDVAALGPEERAWLRRVRGTWLSNAQRRELQLLTEQHVTPGALRRRPVREVDEASTVADTES